YNPDRADRFPFDVEGNQESLIKKGHDLSEVGQVAFRRSKQQCNVALQHRATGAEIPRRPPAPMMGPIPRDGAPVEIPLLVALLQEAESSRVRPARDQSSVGELL